MIPRKWEKNEKMTKEKLEDEICEYVHNHYRVAALGFSYRDLRDVAEHFALPREKRIEELERENAELKGLKDVATLIRANNDTVVTLMQLNNKLVSENQQLNKAKEIIKDLLSCLYSVEYDRLSDLEEAEQFLKDSEVEK